MRNNKLLTALLVNLALFALFSLFFSPHYHINDDPAMMRMASGDYIGKPTEYLIFINVIVGHILKYLYTVIPSLNWYAILMYFLHFLSMTALAYTFIGNAELSFVNSADTRDGARPAAEPPDTPDGARPAAEPPDTRDGAWPAAEPPDTPDGARPAADRPASPVSDGRRIILWPLFIYFLLFAMVTHRFLNSLTFTTTAFSVGISGILLVMSAWPGMGRFNCEDGNSAWLKEPRILFGVLLLTVSALIRIRAFQALMILWIPLCLCQAIRQKSIKVFVPVLMAFLLAFAAASYNEYYYNKEPGWKYYREYNSYRHRISDYPHLFNYSNSTAHVYDSVGWPEINVKMFRSWSFADPELFPLEDLRYIVSQIRTHYRPLVMIISMSNTITRISQPSLYFTIIALIISFLMVSDNYRVYMVISLFAVFTMFIYLACTGRLPDRVAFPLVYFIGAISVFGLTRNLVSLKYHVGQIGKSARAISLIAIVTLILFLFHRDARESRLVDSIQAAVDSELQILKDNDYIYASWPSGLALESRVSSGHIRVHLWNNDTGADIIPFGGFALHSPHYYAVMSRYSIGNIYKDIVTRDDILLISEPERVKRILPNFMKRNYGMDIIAEPVFIMDAKGHKQLNINLFRIRLAENTEQNN